MDSVAGKSYGGCQGSDSMYVKLIASDGSEFIVKRTLALMSGTLKDMLCWPCAEEGETQDVILRDISPQVLAKVCMYLSYKNRYSKLTGEDVPDFNIAENEAIGLLLAADFLNC